MYLELILIRLVFCRFREIDISPDELTSGTRFSQYVLLCQRRPFFGLGTVCASLTRALVTVLYMMDAHFPRRQLVLTGFGANSNRLLIRSG